MVDVISADAKLPLALVGLGDIGLSQHLPALIRHPGVQPTLLIDPDPARRDTAHRVVPDAALADSIDAVLVDERVRGVIVATPPWVTVGLTRQLLEAGRYVLAEKPIAPTVADATGLRALPPELLVRLQVGLTYRHDPAIETLGEWFRQGRFGGPVLIRAQVYDERRDPANQEHFERIVRTLVHGNPAVHEGSHLFDWLSRIVGDPLGIADAWAVRTAREYPAPNLVGARISYPHLCTALVEFGWLTAGMPRSELSFLGTDLYSVLDLRTFLITSDAGGDLRRTTFPGERTTRCFDRQLAAFVDLVEGRSGVARPGLADALAALRTGEELTERLAGQAG